MTNEGILAPRRPPVGQMSVRRAFESKTAREKLYAHHLARYSVKICLWDSVYLILVSAEQLGTVLVLFYVKYLQNPPLSLILSLNCIGRAKETGSLSPHRQVCREQM